MKKLLLLLSILFCVLFAKAQNLQTERDSLKRMAKSAMMASKSAAVGGGSSSAGLAPVSMPIMPSPTAASLVRNATASPNLYTGAVNVSVPLYTLPAQGMNVPVGLVYQSNGVKVNDKNGPLGMTWSLQGGGAVARIVRGYPDEFKGKMTKEIWLESAPDRKEKQEVQISGFWYNTIPTNYKTKIESFNQIIDRSEGKDEKLWDTEPDKYLFSAPGLAGSFYIPEKGKKPIIHCDADIDIQTFIVDGALRGFVITTSSGLCYEFGMQKNYLEKQSFATESKISEARFKRMKGKFYETKYSFEEAIYTKTYLDEKNKYPSTWYLKKIITPYSTDAIYYKYQSDEDKEEEQAKSIDTHYDNSFNDYYFANRSKSNIRVNRYPKDKDYLSQVFTSKQTTTKIYAPKRLTSIASSTGKVVLVYTDDKNRSIKQVRIFGIDKKTLVKSYHLRYTEEINKVIEPLYPSLTKYYTARGRSFAGSRRISSNVSKKGSSSRKFLTEIYEINKTNSDSIQAFKFQYHNPELLPEFCSQFQNQYGLYVNYPNFKSQFYIKENSTCYPMLALDENKSNGSRGSNMSVNQIVGTGTPNLDDNGSNLFISDSTVVNGMLISMQNATGALTKFIYDATFEGAKLKQAITSDGANKVQAIDYKYENPIQPLGFSSRQYKVGEYKTGISPWGRTEHLLTQGAPYGFEKSTVTTNGVKNTSYFTTANTYNNKLAASTSYQEVIEGVNVANGRTGGYDEDERDRYDFYTFKKFLDILTNLYKYEVLDALRKYNGEQNSYECVDFVLAELRKQQIYPSLDFYYERKKRLQTNFRHRVGRPTECDQLRGRVIKTETYNLKGEIASIQQFNYEKYDLNKNTTKKQAYVVSQSDYEANDVKYIVPYSVDYETLRLKSSKSTTYITKNEKTEKESTIESYSSIFPLIPEEVIEKNKNTGDVWKTKNFYVLFDDSNKSKTKMREEDIERDDDETGGGSNSTSLKYQAYPKYAIQKQEVFKNGKQFSGSQVIYDENTQLPKELQTWIKENYETTLTYDKFDYKRRILQAHGRDGIPTAYRYKGNFIDLTAQNATYDEISNGKAEDLRKKLKKAMIASANYSPVGFLTDQTDANGYTLYYEYDDFGRLKLLRDHDQNIVEAYDYQYGKVGQEKVSEEKLGIGQMVLGESFVVGGYTKSKMEGLPSAGKNYIASYGFKKEKATFNDRNNVDKANTTIEYQDGLGRPTQQIAVNSLPQGYSVVQAFEYDSLGRQAAQYRSLPMLGDSKYKKDWKQYLQDRYENTYKAESSYDAFNRVNKQGSFGEEYALSKRPKITHYGMNQAAVESYTIDLNSDQFKKKTYTKGTLIKTAVYYEGITNVVYKNMNGQVVRKGAVQGNQKGDVDHNSGLLTDYVYDDHGNLRAILPPQAKGDITKKEYVYKFHYDERNRLVKKEIPGAGSITMQYDELDRLVRETDAKGVTSYIKYDELSRPVETGYLKKQSAVSDQHSAGKETVLSRTYYDNYDFNFAKANSCSTEHAESNLGRITGSEIRVLGTDTWIKAVSYYDKEGRVIEAISQNNTDGTDRVTSSYNFEGKVTETHVSKTFNGKKYSSKREYDYGKAGELLNVHHGVNGQSSIVLSSFRYNNDGSLAEKRLHNGSIKTNYTYDELDRMVKARSKKLFELELAYDSSLKGANNQFYYDGSLSAMAWKSKNKKRYTYSFDYDKWKNLSAANSTDHPYTTEYHYDRNGNMDWLKRRDSLCTEPGDVYQHFEYKYEGTNQLKKLWRKNTEQVKVWPGDSNNDGKVDVDDQHPVGYNYKLKAKARDTRSTAWKAYMAIQRKGDDLVFSDTDGNGKINELDTIAIHQNMLKTHEIAEATATKPFSYKYDDNGNMVYDEYKKLHISYNILNLPDTLSVTGQGKIVNQYLA
ncbi:DUF6443 domain-containing protein, partial [Marinifilum sp. D737]|uniref:DUF6443 domain-containing protein n=1 Tax=Marinifilum sp. D737 TaxID=2969628 RepID=UPI002273ACB1